MRCVKFEFEKTHVRNFINLYHKIYCKKENMQNGCDLKALLLNKHILSKYFTIHKFCIYNNKNIVGRFAVTVYPNDNIGYVGFVECLNDDDIARFLFNEAYDFAKKEKLIKLIGPVDASFWLKYRLKTNLFDKKPYTGEPYNKEYYCKLFINNGYTVCHRYVSSRYTVLEDSFTNKKSNNRYQRFINKGYIINSPTADNWDNAIMDIYRMISELYKNFPIYKHISQEDFCKLFGGYKYILNYDMVKIAYYNQKPVGFFISVPNYNNLVYQSMNPFNIFKLLKIKKKPTEYIIPYVGVEKEHHGLGLALSQCIIENLQLSKATSIGALIAEGKPTQHYVSEKIADKYEYVLFERVIY